MNAVVLAGGQGARLEPYTRVLPKPLLPVGSRPILEIIIEQLREAGVTRVIVATGYLSGLIETYFGDGSALGIPISYSREVEALGTIGPLGSIGGLDETFILMNGDVLTSPIYGELIAAHLRSGAVATIATRAQVIDVDYGVLELGTSADGVRQISGIDEKPRYSLPVSMGIYAFEPEVLTYVERDHKLDFPDLVKRLLAAGESVAAYEHDGYWMDIGQLHHLETAVRDYEGDAADFAHRTQTKMLEALAAAEPARGRTGR